MNFTFQVYSFNLSYGLYIRLRETRDYMSLLKLPGELLRMVINALTNTTGQTQPLQQPKSCERSLRNDFIWFYTQRLLNSLGVSVVGPLLVQWRSTKEPRPIPGVS